MIQTPTDISPGFWSEFALICRRGRQVWQMVPTVQKGAFALTAVLMTLSSASAVAIPVCLGLLVDAMSSSVETHIGGMELFWTASWFLGEIAVLVLLREVFNVLRRYVVENTCTRIEKQLSV